MTKYNLNDLVMQRNARQAIIIGQVRSVSTQGGTTSYVIEDRWGGRHLYDEPEITCLDFTRAERAEIERTAAWKGRSDRR